MAWRATFVEGQKVRGLPVVQFSAIGFEEVEEYEQARDDAAERAAASTVETMPGLRERKKGWFAASKRNAKKSRKKAPPLLYRMDEREIALVGATMRANGFRRTRSANWNLYWAAGIELSVSDWQSMGRSQRVNQFPMTRNLTRKHLMTRNLVKMQQIHGKRHFDFIPDSYVLPAELPQLREVFARGAAAAEQLWIVKPTDASCGHGIFITDDLAEICEAPLSEEFEGSYIANLYIENPLLVDGLKFDLRVYVAVTSFDPLRVHVFRDGLARFATEPYSSDRSNIDNPYVHLTNYSINKLNQNGFDDGAAAPEQEEEGDAPAHTEGEGASIESDFARGTKRSIAAVFERLVRDGLVASTDELWASIDDIVVKSLLSVDREVVAATRRGVAHAGTCFQMFGFDILFDDALKPWLIEVNFSPSLATDAEIDMSIKGRAIAELLTVAGVQPFTHKSLDQQKSKRSSGVGGYGKWSSRHTTRENREIAASRIFALGLDGNFAPEEKRALTALRAEEQRAEQCRSSWERVFPTANAMHYRTFFEHGDDKRDRLLDVICLNALYRKRADNEGKAPSRLEVQARREIKAALGVKSGEAGRGDDERVAAARSAARARVKARSAPKAKVHLSAHDREAQAARVNAAREAAKSRVRATRRARDAEAAAAKIDEASVDEKLAETNTFEPDFEDTEDDAAADAEYEAARARFGFKVHDVGAAAK